MRIISGEARGRTLYAPAGLETRPTSDKLRGSIFNILGARVIDANVLDLFGGTGALALEALSRGAAYAVIADVSAKAVQVIRRNAQHVLGDEGAGKAGIMRADYRQAIDRLEACSFDIIFLDPPYRMGEAYADALTRLMARGRLRSGGLAVLERARAVDIQLPGQFERADTRIYGDTAVDFVRWEMADKPA